MATLTLLGERVEHHDRLCGERRQVDRSVALCRIFAHRANDRQQVPRGGRYIVPIACIIAAERAVRAIDDPLGTFDDSIDRRPKDLLQCAVEIGDLRASSTLVGGTIDDGRTPEAGEASVSSGDDFAAQVQESLLRRCGSPPAGR